MSTQVAVHAVVDRSVSAGDRSTAQLHPGAQAGADRQSRPGFHARRQAAAAASEQRLDFLLRHLRHRSSQFDCVAYNKADDDADGRQINARPPTTAIRLRFDGRSTAYR